MVERNDSTLSGGRFRSRIGQNSLEQEGQCVTSIGGVANDI